MTRLQERLAANLLALLILATACLTDDQNGNDLPGLSAAEVVRLRGFRAEELHLTTSSGYIINIVRATNPLINNGDAGLEGKDPVVFVHGILANAKCFLVDSVGAEPEDLSQLDVTNMSRGELARQLVPKAASRSLAFLLLNFGHEVYLVNRRGTQYSRGHRDDAQGRLASAYRPQSSDGEGGARTRIFGITEKLMRMSLRAGLKAIAHSFYSAQERVSNPSYWNYTADTEAREDIPEIVDFVLEKTGRAKLSYVGHSLGAGLLLMSLAVKPELGDKRPKVLKALLWAPGVNFGSTMVDERSFMRTAALDFLRPLESYTGPVPVSQLSPRLTGALARFCNPRRLLNSLCAGAVSMVFGPGGGQLNLRPGFLSIGPDTVASHELAQLIQMVRKSGSSSFYDYGSSQANEAAYGQSEPPRYNFSSITFPGLALYYGKSDSFVQYQDQEQLLRELKVPLHTRFFDDPGLEWNHLAFLVHKRIAQYLNVPSLKLLSSAD